MTVHNYHVFRENKRSFSAIKYTKFKTTYFMSWSFKAVESIENVYTAWGGVRTISTNGCRVYVTTQSYLVWSSLVCHSSQKIGLYCLLTILVAFCGSINTILYPLGLLFRYEVNLSSSWSFYCYFRDPYIVILFAQVG